MCEYESSIQQCNFLPFSTNFPPYTYRNILHDRDDPNALMISIIDLQGINLSILRKPELLNFVKTFVAMIDAHYPTRAYKTYMINAPKWFSTLYKVIKPVMRETTKEKIVLYSAGPAQNKALEEALGKDMAKLVQRALQIPGQDNNHKDDNDNDSDNDHSGKKNEKDTSDLRLTSDILLETPMEQEMRNFVSCQRASTCICACTVLLRYASANMLNILSLTLPAWYNSTFNCYNDCVHF